MKKDCAIYRKGGEIETALTQHKIHNGVNVYSSGVKHRDGAIFLLY